MDKSNEQVINMNKLVMKFMGVEPTNDLATTSEGIVYLTNGYIYNNKFLLVNRMQFHSSPEWQIPVLNKIMDIAKENRWIGFSITTATSFVRHNMKDIVNYVCSMGGALDQKYFSLSSKSSMAEATFGCICKFIEWYNGINKV